MKFTRELAGSLTIRRISDDGILINDKLCTETVALTAEEIVGGWQKKKVAELAIEDFDELLQRSPEMLLLGTGSKIEFAPRELTFAFARRGIGLEVMDTAAAARTFNVLASEGRIVAAVLYR